MVAIIGNDDMSNAIKSESTRLVAQLSTHSICKVLARYASKYRVRYNQETITKLHTMSIYMATYWRSPR